MIWKKTFVCRRCRFAILAPYADGWIHLQDDNTGICPACVSDLKAEQPSGNGEGPAACSDVKARDVRRN
jgi:hypothetical protein